MIRQVQQAPFRTSKKQRYFATKLRMMLQTSPERPLTHDRREDLLLMKEIYLRTLQHLSLQFGKRKPLLSLQPMPWFISFCAGMPRFSAFTRLFSTGEHLGTR